MTSHNFSSRQAAQNWIHTFKAELTRPCVVLLSGDVGAGKTQFVRWFLEELGVPQVASPTFAIHHQYNHVAGPIDHIDLYRITGDADLEATGFWDLLDNMQALLFVEWADRLPREIWPKGWKQIDLNLRKVGMDEARSLEVEIRKP